MTQQKQAETDANRSCFSLLLYILTNASIDVHCVPAAWCRRAQASIKAEFPSENQPTMRVRLRISLFNCFTRMLLWTFCLHQCIIVLLRQMNRSISQCHTTNTAAAAMSTPARRTSTPRRSR